MPNLRRPLLSFGLALFAWLLGLAFFWAFPALPFQDLIAHAGFLAERTRYAHSPLEQSVLVYSPRLGPYSLFHALGAGVGALLGPLPAMRAIASLVWTAYPAASVWAGYRLFGRRSAADAFAGMLLALGFMTMLGLLGFQLAAALLLVVDVEWLRLLREPTPKAWRVGRFALLPLLLFFAHGFAFALFLGLAAVAWTRTPVPARRAWLGLLPGAGVALIAAARAWLDPIPGAAASAGLLPIRVQSTLDKLSLLLTPTLLTRFGVDALVAVALWLLAGTLVWRALRSSPRGPRRTLAWQALAGFGFFLALPHGIGPLGFVDSRVLPTVLALALLCREREGGRDGTADTDTEPDAPHLTHALAAATFVLLGCGLVASFRFQREAVGARRIADAIPEGARLLHLPLDPDSRAFVAHPFLHYDKLALIERPVIVSDVWFHAATALYPRASHPSLALPSDVPYSVLGEARWDDYRWQDWDRVLIRTQLDAPEPAGIPAALVRIDHVGGFWLYRVEKPY